MASLGILSFVSLSLLILYASAAPPETLLKPSTITPLGLLPRQTQDPFLVGWYSTHGTYSPYYCRSSGTDYYTLCQTSGYAVCWSSRSNGCFPWTRCAGSESIIDIGGTTSCEDGRTCATETIYPTLGATESTHLVWCMSGSPFTYYKESPATTTTSPSPTPDSLSSSTTSSSSTSSSPTPAPTPAPKKSKAWVAGVVIGPVTVIAIAGLGFWVFKLKRRNQQLGTQPSPAGPANVGPPPIQSPSMYYTGPPPQPSMSPPPQMSQVLPNPTNPNIPQITQGWGQTPPEQGYYKPPAPDAVEVPSTQVTALEMDATGTNRK